MSAPATQVIVTSDHWRLIETALQNMYPGVTNVTNVDNLVAVIGAVAANRLHETKELIALRTLAKEQRDKIAELQTTAANAQHNEQILRELRTHTISMSNTLTRGRTS